MQTKKRKPKGGSKTEIVFSDETKVHPNLKDILCYCIHKSALILKSRMNKELAQFDVQLPHLGIMRVLAANETVSQNQMCEEMGIDKASMVKLIDHLEVRGLVERVGSKQDRRVKNLHLTRAAKDLLNRAQKVREKQEAVFLQTLSPSDAAKFRELVIAVLSANA